MLTKLFFPTIAGVRVDRVWWEDQTLHLAATMTRRAARCPLCNRRSKRVHSTYPRTSAALPCAGACLTVHLRARRLVGRVCWGRRTVFCERLPALAAPWGRRTTRQREALERTGFALGGAPGARYATAAGMPLSRRTLLRVVRAVPCPQAGRVRVLGVDDWSNRRGRTDGTILVNLQTHAVIDLVPDRTAATLARWLQEHPAGEVVSRDRAEAYAEGIRQGAPQAVHVADRFHLVKNVTDSVEHFLKRKHAALRQAAQDLATPIMAPSPPEPASLPGAGADPSPGPTEPPRRLTRHEQESQACRARRLARYEEVMVLHRQGQSLRAIAHATGLCRTTVRRSSGAAGFPACQPRGRHSRVLAPVVTYLHERWAQGCQNARVLYAEVHQRG